MNENFKELIDKFIEINQIGYIKGINNNIFNSAGLTFENLLKKKPDDIYFPDFKDIEIKTTQRFSRYPITLFSSTFDGPNLYEANSLLEKYGKNDLHIQNRKNLIVNLQINKQVKIDENIFFELCIDNKEKLLYINIYDKQQNFIERRAFINFQTLEVKFNVKLKNLAVIHVSKKIIDGNLYFRYYKINCYECKDFYSFINSIKTGKVKATLMLRTGKSGKYTGTNKNKNLIFSINKNDLSSLFDEIYCYEN